MKLTLVIGDKGVDEDDCTLYYGLYEGDKLIYKTDESILMFQTLSDYEGRTVIVRNGN